MSQLHGRSKCKCDDKTAQSRAYFENNGSQKSFHVIIEISFRGLSLRSALVETSAACVNAEQNIEEKQTKTRRTSDFRLLLLHAHTVV